MIIFAHPFDGSGSSVQLRNPELMDKFEAHVDVAFRTAMDGTIYGKRRTIQPTTLMWKFVELPREEAQTFREFIEAAAGDSVRLVHFDGSTWQGKLTLTRFDVTNTGTGLGSVAESASVSIEFEGTKL